MSFEATDDADSADEEPGAGGGDQRGAAEEASGVPETSGEHEGPASPSSTPGGEDSRVDGAAEEASGHEGP
jgi:hypothetical protein